jgi:hypothetical protein
MHCGVRLGFHPRQQVMVSLEPRDSVSTAEIPTRASLFQASGASNQPAEGEPVRLCASYIEHDACNWIVPQDEPEPFCLSCRLNDVIPNLDTPPALIAWKRLEAAKRRLLHTLLTLGLPVVPRREESGSGLSFVFKQYLPGGPAVTTGYASGVITINIAEADDAHREKTRAQLGEKYRSLLGHFRHESGHYYWQRLIASTGWLEEFRTLFGDESADYAAAIATHYDRGAAPNWHETHVSPYAAAHPWEDWAETWAHYLHITDTLETACCYGIALQPRPAGGRETRPLVLGGVDLQEFDAMIEAWVPLTLALNDFNRGMGLPDLYPFALSPAAVTKIGFVHRVVHAKGVDVPAAGQADRPTPG